MENVDFVGRRYLQILPKPVDLVKEPSLERLIIWLTDDVCPVIEDFVQRPAFREHATWVLHTIGPKSPTPERREIEALDAALVRCAQVLTKLASKEQIRKNLTALYPAKRVSLERAVELRGDGDGGRIISRREQLIDELSLELRQAAAWANRPWKDLINFEDYLEPQQEFVKTNARRKKDPRWLQRGEFIVSLNPKLHPVGDFVVRCMFQRVDSKLTALNALRAKIMHAIRKVGRSYSDQPELDAAWEALQASHAAVRKMFKTGADNQLRDSCMILAQIYAAFDPSPDLRWLDVASEAIERGQQSLGHRIKEWHNGEMFERIAKAVSDLSRLYAERPPGARDRRSDCRQRVGDRPEVALGVLGANGSGPRMAAVPGCLEILDRSGSKSRTSRKRHRVGSIWQQGHLSISDCDEGRAT